MQDINNMQNLLFEFQKIPKKSISRTFMEISGYPHYENVCSNILNFYFESYNEHNLKDLFYKSLLDVLNQEFDNNYFTEISSYREFPTDTNNRIDLLIESDKYVIGIENKIYHNLNNDLRDYAEKIDTEAKRKNKSSLKIVLSLRSINHSNINENDFINITYSDFFSCIKNNLGLYIEEGNDKYINILKDFIITIQNLIGGNMKNKELEVFFRDNGQDVQNLVDEFNNYKSSLYSKVHELEGLISKNNYAINANEVWIYKNKCLVHDYIINNEYKISIDTYIDFTGWEIQLFSRNNKSFDFLMNKMCSDNNFLGKNIGEFEIREERIIFATREIDDITGIADCLIDLLKRIENYIKNSI